MRPVDASTILPIGNYYLLVLDDFEALTLTRELNLDAAVLELHRRGAQQVIVRQKFDWLIFSDGVRRNRQPIPHGKFVQAAGAAECLVAWAGITLAMTGDLARAARAGAEAMASAFHGPAHRTVRHTVRSYHLTGHRPISSRLHLRLRD